MGTSLTNSYSDSGLSVSTTYAYAVSAYDAAGNNSPQGSSASATTRPGSQASPLAGDLNLDHVVNAIDYSIMNSHWLQNYPAADLNGDGVVNSADFAVLKSNWGKTW